MQYKLTKYGRGYLLEGGRSIFCDLSQGLELSFLIPDWLNDVDYVATILTENNRKHQLFLERKGDCEYTVKVQSYLLEPQLLQVSISACRSGQVVKCWLCEAIRIASLNGQLCVVRHVDSALVETLEKEHVRQQHEIDELKDENKAKDERISSLEQAIEAVRQELAEHKQNTNERINTLVDAQTTLVRQVSLIENNYSVVDTIGGN